MTDRTGTTEATRRVIDDAADVCLLEQRLSIARKRLELSERDLDGLNNPRRDSAIDVIDEVLRHASESQFDLTSTAISVWLALRRSGHLVNDEDKIEQQE